MVAVMIAPSAVRSTCLIVSTAGSPAMAAPDSEAIQIRILDGSGDGSAVVVDLSDKDGKQLSERDKIADRIRQQLATFFKISG